MKDDEIKIKIAEVAKQEFLSLGYVDASMRNISAKAGLTTGSLYNRFRDKAELFEFIVGDGVKVVFREFANFNQNHAISGHTQEYKDSAIKYILDTMFENYDSFDLIINKGLGSPYETFMQDLISVATENIKEFVYNNMEGNKDMGVAEDLSHLLNVALFDALAEIFRKHYTKEEADYYMKTIFTFYNAGWSAILK